MLNFRNTLAAFFITLVALVIADYYLAVTPWLYLGIVLVMLSLMIWGSISISSGFYLKSLCRGNSESKAVAFSFDDGPDGEFTPRLLDVLRENKVQAVFFVIGSRAEKNPGLVKRIREEGHILGGHSQTHHFFFDLFFVEKMKQELKTTEATILNITGKRTRLFRPPYGVTNPTVAKVIRTLNYLSIGWSLKSRDTVIDERHIILDRLKKRVKPGDIILFHDNRAVTAQVVEEFINWLTQQNYQIDRLDHLLQIEAYAY